MKPVCFKRVFTNNNGYDKYESIPYLKSLALTVQDFLYTKKAENNDVDFNMSKHIKLYDFMNLAVYFISAASSDFGKSSIQSYINDIQQGIDRDYPLYKERVEVIHDGKNLFVSCASFELLISILWTTYIYVKFYYELSGDEQYKRATDMIKEIMLEKNRYSVSHFNTLHPIKDTKGALMFMAKNLATHGEGKTQKKTTETKDSATIAQLQNRIAELEAENKALKEKIVQNDNVLLNTNEDSTISSLKDEILFLKKRIKDYEETYKCLPAREAAIFTLAICEEWKQIPNDRQKLWPFMNTLWGFSQTTSEKRLREGISQYEADNLAKKFKTTPRVARLIREIPEKLQKKKEEDLLAKNPKKKN